jgi:hypothetical protein
MLPSVRLAMRKSLSRAQFFAETNMTDQQLAANRANTQLSTGPTSPEGKAKASLNAVKTALTGRTVLLSCDDAAMRELSKQMRGQLRQAATA